MLTIRNKTLLSLVVISIGMTFESLSLTISNSRTLSLPGTVLPKSGSSPVRYPDSSHFCIYGSHYPQTNRRYPDAYRTRLHFCGITHIPQDLRILHRINLPDAVSTDPGAQRSRHHEPHATPLSDDPPGDSKLRISSLSRAIIAICLPLWGIVIDRTGIPK